MQYSLYLWTNSLIGINVLDIYTSQNTILILNGNEQ